MAKSKPSENDLLNRIKRDFKLVCDAEAPQRDREKEDLEFQSEQWNEKDRSDRKGRPTLTVNLLRQPLQLIKNQATNAHLGVDVSPVNEEASKELAEIKQGLYRRIERDSNAQAARLWALDRAAQCGRGYYLVTTQFDEDSEFADQEISIERIFYQGNVYMDPSAQQPDCSDARWGMIATWVPLDAFEDQFPKAKYTPTESDFASWRQNDPTWVQENTEGKAVLVVQYYYKTYAAGLVTGVRVAKATSQETLEDQEWAGMYIPIIQVGGVELQPFDGEHRWEGIVRPARDGQKFTNYAASTLVESMASEPKTPWIGTAQQFEGYEEEWRTANTKNRPVLRYKPHELPSGQLAPPPTRTPVDSSKMTLSLQAFGVSKEFVQSTTAVHQASLGELPVDQTAQSGRALLALQQQTDAGTSHFLQNLARVSMRYEARVILDLMPKIYDRPGRITRVLGMNDEPKMVALNAPFVPGQGPQEMPMMPPPPGAEPDQIKEYDLSKGKYAISVSVGKSFQTRLQEGATEMGAILERQPQLLPLIGDIYYKFRDFPGHDDIAERLAQLRKMQFPGLGDDEEQGLTLQDAMGAIQALQQRLQQSEQEKAAAIQKLETDFAKQQATIAKAQMDMQSKAADRELKEAIAELGAQVQVAIAQMNLTGKAAEVETQVEEREKDRQHEADQDQFEADHEAGMAILTAGMESPPAGSLELEEEPEH